MSYVHVTGLACVLKLCPSPFPSISMSASKWGDWELNVDILMAKICMCFLPYSSHVELSKMVTSIWYKIILKECRLESWNAFMFSFWCLCKIHVFSKHIFLMSLYFSQVDEKSSFDIWAWLTLGLTLVFLPWSGMVESGVWQLQFWSLLWRACSAGGGFFVCKMRSVTQILPTAPPCPSLPQFWVTSLMCQLLSRVWLVEIPRTVGSSIHRMDSLSLSYFHPSIGFSKQEYWSGLQFPPPMTSLSSLKIESSTEQENMQKEPQSGINVRN